MAPATITQEPPLIAVQRDGDVAVVRFVEGRMLDDSNVSRISRQLFHLVDRDGYTKLLLDFAAVEYLSSAALGTMITLDKKLRAAGGQLRLCNMDPKIYQVFAVTRLDKVLHIYPSEAEAAF